MGSAVMFDPQAIIGGGKKENRKESDFYPTPLECVIAFLAAEGRWLSRIEWIKEPACGDGAISKVLISKGYKVQSADIADRGYGITGVDFLKTKSWVPGIITNPPFNLADQFANHAIDLDVDYIALLLKSQFWHAAKRKKLFAKRPPSVIYAMTWRPDFDGRGSPTMECIWTVWDKARPDITLYRLLEK